MLSPKKTKYQKYQKGKVKNIKKNTQKLSFGKYGIKSASSWRLSARTIEAIRRVISRKLKRTGKTWIRVFPDIPVTKKPAEVRMGKGKGSIHFWVVRICKGQILFEIDGVTEKQAYNAFSLIREKIPFPINFISFD
uniref:ribosomal protein L16 n=1 Tax=Tetraselmis marina TaxID=41888 RepID=UPI00218250FD|nr:ribosomal protein L16 [Tetraselmis marina]UVF37913.1 ribosomal protein L16 [Tetraselmis marina]